MLTARGKKYPRSSRKKQEKQEQQNVAADSQSDQSSPKPATLCIQAQAPPFPRFAKHLTHNSQIYFPVIDAVLASSSAATLVLAKVKVHPVMRQLMELAIPGTRIIDVGKGGGRVPAVGGAEGCGGMAAAGGVWIREAHREWGAACCRQG